MRVILTIISILLVSGCITTALYGNQFQPVGDDQYSLEIMFGGLPMASETEIETETRKVLIAEADKFISESFKYNSYEILRYERTYIPSAIVYTVRFSTNKPSQKESR